jgi:hypothetical protein
MGPVPLWGVDILVLLVAMTGAVWIGLWEFPRRVAARWALRHPRARRSEPAEPAKRPIEDVVLHARRLGRQFHQPPNGRSLAKLEGIRRAYDDVLAECCDELRIDHLLRVLATGDELDAERSRVERRLELGGVDLWLTW